MIEMSSPDTDEITGTFLKNRFEFRFKFMSSKETWLFKMVDNKFIFPSKKRPHSSTKKDKFLKLKLVFKLPRYSSAKDRLLILPDQMVPSILV